MSSSSFDGINWTCEKCHTVFNLFEEDKLRARCPSCGKTASQKDIEGKPFQRSCAFQSLFINWGKYQGVTCELTAWGVIGTGMAGNASKISKQPCQIELCSIYQTWKKTSQY